MNYKKAILLDANILVRAILGVKVPTILDKYQNIVNFYTASQCFDEVNEHLPLILAKRGIKSDKTMLQIKQLKTVVHQFNESIYLNAKDEAQARIQSQDIDDWPLIALSILFNYPIWTEDKDFFGTGVPTWRTHNVEIYLQEIGRAHV